MADVFISYKHEDRTVAGLIVDKLTGEGFSVWWDDDITPRNAWDATIEREIGEATSVVVLWSPRSVESDWVRTEAHFGHERRKLVPATIESCEPPLAFRLTQTIDLTGWQGDPEHRAWRKLLTWLADLRSALPGAQAPDTPPANPFHDTVGSLASGEPIVDGVFVNEATPAGTLFRDGEGLPVMRVLPRGRFLMGGSPGDPTSASFELPQKLVKIDYPFAVGVFPVTNAEFDAVSERVAQPAAAPRRRSWFAGKPPEPAAPIRRAAADCPATDVSWLAAREYCRAVSERTGSGYRLPSEAEWEYACRAGSAGRYAGGDEIDASRGCFGQAAGGGPIAPGSFQANAFGLHDMHGNVREWVEDLWHDSYDGATLDGRPAVHGHGSMRVTRGGCWCDPPGMLRSSARGRATESVRSDAIGFRVVRELMGRN